MSDSPLIPYTHCTLYLLHTLYTLYSIHTILTLHYTRYFSIALQEGTRIGQRNFSGTFLFLCSVPIASGRERVDHGAKAPDNGKIGRQSVSSVQPAARRLLEVALSLPVLTVIIRLLLRPNPLSAARNEHRP